MAVRNNVCGLVYTNEITGVDCFADDLNESPCTDAVVTYPRFLTNIHKHF